MCSRSSPEKTGSSSHGVTSWVGRKTAHLFDRPDPRLTVIDMPSQHRPDRTVNDWPAPATDLPLRHRLPYPCLINSHRHRRAESFLSEPSATHQLTPSSTLRAALKSAPPVIDYPLHHTTSPAVNDTPPPFTTSLTCPSSTSQAQSHQARPSTTRLPLPLRTVNDFPALASSSHAVSDVPSHFVTYLAVPSTTIPTALSRTQSTPHRSDKPPRHRPNRQRLTRPAHSSPTPSVNDLPRHAPSWSLLPVIDKPGPA